MAENVCVKKETDNELAAKAGKYLTFLLGGEVYGLEILKVQEIIGMMKITRVPRMPNFVSGVINLRGKVIPVVDLRLKFGMEGKQNSEKTCIIVVQVIHNVNQIIMGILVDEVSEVLNINVSQLESAPEFGTNVETNFILGIGKVGQKVIILLNIDKVLSNKEITAINKTE